MKNARLESRMMWLAGLPLVFSLLVGDGRVTGQEGEKKPAAEKKEAKKPRGRLPAYFSTVVTSKQREEVYTVQAKYSKQLEDLEKQIAALRAEMLKEVDAVLTPEQLAEVKKKRNEAAAKKKSGAQKPPAKTDGK